MDILNLVTQQIVGKAFRDKASSVNQLGAIAREQGLNHTCIDIVTTLYSFETIDANEACIKLSEQGKAYLEEPAERLLGLRVMNTEGVQYFEGAQQAEIFRQGKKKEEGGLKIVKGEGGGNKIRPAPMGASWSVLGVGVWHG